MAHAAHYANAKLRGNSVKCFSDFSQPAVRRSESSGSVAKVLCFNGQAAENHVGYGLWTVHPGVNVSSFRDNGSQRYAADRPAAPAGQVAGSSVTCVALAP